MRHPPAHAPASARRPGLRRTGGPLAVLALAVGLLVVSAPATAHDALVGSDPADGAVLSAAPTQVVLTFAAPQAGIGAEVAVTGPDGATWSDGPAQTSDATVTQPLLPSMPDGAYTVTWRSVAQDGHPVSGVFGFTLQLPVDPEPDAGATNDGTADVVAAPAGGATATTGDPAGTVMTAADPGAPLAEPAEQSGGGWRWWYSLLLALVLGGAVVLVAVRRGRAARG